MLQEYDQHLATIVGRVPLDELQESIQTAEQDAKEADIEMGFSATEAGTINTSDIIRQAILAKSPELSQHKTVDPDISDVRADFNQALTMGRSSRN